MIIGALFSFLGGSAFRAIIGEVSTWLTAKREHGFELDRMNLQEKIDAAQHGRNMAAIKMQSDLQVEVIRVQGDQAVGLSDANAFYAAQQVAMQPIGIAWVDAWNATVRPAFATLVLMMWALILYRQGWVPSVWDLDLMGGIAGFFFADRAMGKRGK